MSTPLRLSAADQRRLVAASTALLSPLAYPDDAAWHRAVAVAMRDLMGGDQFLLILPNGEKSTFLTEDFGASVVDDYPDWFEPVAAPLDLYERFRTLGAASRTMLYVDMPAFYRTAYWNDYLRAHKSYDSVTMSVAVGPRPTLADHAQIIVNHDNPHANPFGDHEAGLGRLLLPAFQTGVVMWRRLIEARQARVAMVDALPLAALVYSVGGTELHRNPAAARLLGSDPTAPALTAVAEQMARALATPSSGEQRCGWSPPPARACAGQFVLRATHLNGGIGEREEAVLVTIEGAVVSVETAADPAALEVLRERFRLTPQQARVALLLAARRSTAEIADALFISTHTVRRHTERVLDAVGVPRRDAVEGALREALATVRV